MRKRPEKQDYCKMNELIITLIIVYMIIHVIMIIYNMVLNYYTLKKIQKKKVIKDKWFWVNSVSSAMTSRYIYDDVQEELGLIKTKLKCNEPQGIETRIHTIENDYYESLDAYDKTVSKPVNKRLALYGNKQTASPPPAYDHQHTPVYDNKYVPANENQNPSIYEPKKGPIYENKKQYPEYEM